MRQGTEKLWHDTRPQRHCLPGETLDFRRKTLKRSYASISSPPNQRNSTSDDYTDMTWHHADRILYRATRPKGRTNPVPGNERAWWHGRRLTRWFRVAAKVLACSALRA
jgi:hypothetical protein